MAEGDTRGGWRELRLAVRRDGSGAERLTRGEKPGVWSPDGRRIAFAADLFDPEPTLEYRIATVAAGGGRVRVHWKSRRFIAALDWQPR